MTYINSPASFQTKQDIIWRTDCPFCGALEGTACTWVGNWAEEKMVQDQSHDARMWRAQDVARGFTPDQFRVHASLGPPVSCSYCGAQPGQPCVKANGRPRVRGHRARATSSRQSS